jgi:hypothetical protein
MKIKIIIFIIFFLISFTFYYFHIMIYSFDNTEISMADLSKEQNDRLKNEMGLNQFNTLIITNVNYSTVWGMI